MVTNNKSAGAAICVACLGQGARVAFAPCGHVSYCDPCWAEVARAPQHARSCPVCCASGCAIKLFYQYAPSDEVDGVISSSSIQKHEPVKIKEPKQQPPPPLPAKHEDDDTCTLELSTFLENLMLF